jgi:hypothetical protein
VVELLVVAMVGATLLAMVFEHPERFGRGP